MKELITVAGLEKSFYMPAGELKVLKGIDAVFGEGEVVSIVGASGAGKSTFLHVLGTLDKPTSGEVTYKVGGQEIGQKGDCPAPCGIDPFSLSNGELAAFRNSVIGFIFQFHYLLPEFTAIENVMMPGKIALGRQPSAAGDKEIYEKAERLLNELGIYARKDHKPGELSGGEQQRVAVARALFLDPKVVFADEPTGNLDTATGEELFRLLMDINSKYGTTFIIVTHNEHLSKRCHRIMEMVDGKLR
ncbi:MAG: ABC transporter ATP-binding protein [Nitrospirae bacterium GWC2_46_6]|nr:MAG: ABC transporter ATP-binding protein [Nitrospirae bacterium GWA2_46_11]OGW23408.1 MAG: ABC transporter ATP-binding protein [Nitrospirae bacterium GWC2_46_6]OGW24437.1 MAG: ABC transporter ATP-binding protein [Nitrospirae bacterium GWB2_47_37]HAK89484.1 lipoprotein-releasing system ATP-binding protein LolD [Nitrospiraceae bacterium]HCL82270.1 lipoprotein-releasing system ATP-binding protein LolD [Nitrospiraceae bacterium]